MNDTPNPGGPAPAPAAAPESLAAILREMRDLADHRAADAGGERPGIELLRSYADRIDAAVERERAVAENTSDGYHTFRELYRYRMLYNAAFFNMLARHTGIPVVKSHRHGDGEPCFGGGWFIVMAQLPAGQVSNHYEDRYWELFDVPEAEMAPEWDGHTPNDAADRLESFLLEMREPEKPESGGNAATMREALRVCFDFIVRLDRAFNPVMQNLLENAIAKAEAALAAPARNCDRLETHNEAKAAFLRSYFGPTEPEFVEDAFARWAFAPAEGGEA